LQHFDDARRQDLTAAKSAIEELFTKISDIRRKAEASEVMVQEICRDIRKLDFAKTHLTHTITALRRLAMLVNAVGARPELTPHLLVSRALWSLCARRTSLMPHLQHTILALRHWRCGGRGQNRQRRGCAASVHRRRSLRKPARTHLGHTIPRLQHLAMARRLHTQTALFTK
jgi:hypothetical protein